MQNPGMIRGPERILELVLDVKQPDANRGGHKRDRQVDEEEWTNANEPHHHSHQNRYRDVRHHGAEPRLPTTTHQARGQPVSKNEQVGRPKAEHDDWMAVKAIAKPTPL